MSRIGKLPVTIPKGVEVTMAGNLIKIKGPKGVLEHNVHRNMKVNVETDRVTVGRPNDIKMNKALHGLTRALIQNMVIGVTDGYKRTLEMIGVGYRAELKGKTLVMAVGYSHAVLFRPPDDVTLTVEGRNNVIIIEGINKQRVGEAAARIRKVRPPEPYKGKGIKYQDEIIKRKAGKTAGA